MGRTMDVKSRAFYRHRRKIDVWCLDLLKTSERTSIGIVRLRSSLGQKWVDVDEVVVLDSGHNEIIERFPEPSKMSVGQGVKSVVSLTRKVFTFNLINFY